MRISRFLLLTRNPAVAAVPLCLLLLAATAYAQGVESFKTGEVQLLGGSYYKQMQALNASSNGTMGWLEPDDLLYEFREEAGLSQPGGAQDLEGRWEGDAGGGGEFGFVRGHTTGHYLTAASRMYALTGSQDYLNKINDIVSGLADVQAAFNNNGYMSALPESAFTALENNQMSFPTAWVPYYTQHKILAGLNDAHTYTGNQQALDVAFDNAQYFVDRVNGLPQNVVEQMVKSHENQGREFGGMNEVLTDLYVKADAASDPRAAGFLNLANVFNNRELMDQLAAGIDALPGIHANTHIPQAVGWARYGAVTGDQDAVNAAVNFWDIVVRDHTFVTGGNSYAEYFHAAGEETGPGGSALTGRTSETCNVNNMLRLTAELFKHSPQQKYAAYAENALINDIFPSIEPNNGTFTYFMPLEPGRYKTYSTWHTHDGSHWCCCGTGIENPTRYTDLTYFKDNDYLYVNTFMPSQVNWAEKSVTLTQEGDSTTADETMHMTVNTGGGAEQAALKIRIPSWAYGDVQVTINGQPYQGEVNRGEYLELDRQWQDGDTIDVTFDKKLYLRRSQDDPDMVSVYYGAVLLAGELGTQNLPGNDQQITNEWEHAEDSIPVSVPDIDAINADPETWLVPVPGQDMHFELYDNGSPTGIIFKPFYETHHERYSVYWELNAPAATRTWRGGGPYNTVQEATNWDIAPAPGDSLEFDGDLTTSVDNNYANGTAFNNIFFASGASAFTLSGNRIALQGAVTNWSSQTQTIQADLELQSGNHGFNPMNGPMVVSGRLAGNGTLVKNGSYQLTLMSDNNSHSATVVNQGELHVGNGGTTGSLGSGDVTLANNATVAFDRSDNTDLTNAISGNGNLKKLGQGTLTVIKQQQYTGQTIIDEGTLRVGSGSVSGGTFTLDFNSVGGTVDDAQGQGTGFTRRLSGTYNPTNDPNLDINTSAGELLITSGGPSDFYNEQNLGAIEAPGINLSDLGLNSNSDFTITASFQDAPSSANYRQYGLYVGDSAYRLLRGGYLDVDQHQLFGVNNTSGQSNDSNLVLTTAGAPSTGGDVDVVLSRIAGIFSIMVNGVDVTPGAQMTELNGLSDLTLGVFSLHTSGGGNADFTVPLTQFTVSSPDLSSNETFEGGLPTGTDVLIAAGAALDLNDFDQTVASLTGGAGSSILMGNSQSNTLTVNGDVTLAGSILSLDIFDPGSHDLIDVSGNLSAGGSTLDVTLGAGAPALQLGDSFDILDFGSATGAFNTLNLPALGGGLFWDTSDLLTTGILEVVDSLVTVPGDADGDGDVDLDDYNIMSGNMYTATGNGASDGDFNDDGFVDFEDFVIQSLNFGDWPSAEETVGDLVPEPASMALMLLGLSLATRRRGEAVAGRPRS